MRKQLSSLLALSITLLLVLSTGLQGMVMAQGIEPPAPAPEQSNLDGDGTGDTEFVPSDPSPDPVDTTTGGDGNADEENTDDENQGQDGDAAGEEGNGDQQGDAGGGDGSSIGEPGEDGDDPGEPSGGQTGTEPEPTGNDDPKDPADGEDPVSKDDPRDPEGEPEPGSQDDPEDPDFDPDDPGNIPWDGPNEPGEPGEQPEEPGDQPAVDGDALETAVNEAGGAGADGYTEDSWDALETALAAARAALANEDATQEDIDGALAALRAALAGLTKIEPLPEPDNPAVDIAITADQMSYFPGDIVKFTIAVENYGNVDLADLLVEDSLTGFSKTLDLPVGAAQRFYVSYNIDEDAEELWLTNEVSVSGSYQPEEGEAVVVGDSDAITVSVGELQPEIFAHNPDGLVETELSTSVTEVWYPTYADLYPDSVKAAAMARMVAAPGGNIEPWGQPGSIKLDKYATPVDGVPNQWQVTLEIEGKDKEIESTSDIVLVIDRSGSMEGSRMTSAKNAAKEFVDTVLKPGDTTTRIALVSYSSQYSGATNVSIDHQFIGYTAPGGGRQSPANKSLKDAINGLVALGGTFTQAGLHQAQALLDVSEADFKTIVLLSDGEATVSYRINNVSNYFSNSDHFRTQYVSGSGNRIVSQDRWNAGHFDYGTSVHDNNGTTSITQAGYTGQGFGRTYYYYHHGNSAVAEAKFAKNKDTIIYSIGFEVNSEAQIIMDAIASGNRSYSATQSNLMNIFADIAGEVTQIPAARNAVVTDVVGDMFSLVGNSSNITVSHGSASYDQQNKTITCNGFDVEEGITYTMSYIVEIDPSAIGGVDYPTNEYAKINYKNVDNQPATKDFPEPEVQIQAAGRITIKKIVEQGGPTNKNFFIYVDGPDNRTWTVMLKHGQSKTITGLGAGTYTIREVLPMNYKPAIISPASVDFTVLDVDKEVEVTVTNEKTRGGWFWDDDEKINELKVKTSNATSSEPSGPSLSGLMGLPEGVITPKQAGDQGLNDQPEEI